MKAMMHLSQDVKDESRELLQKMRLALLHLETQPASEEVLNTLCSAVRALKAKLALLQAIELDDFANRIAAVLERVKHRQILLTLPMIAIFLAFCDQAEDALLQLSEQQGSNRWGELVPGLLGLLTACSSGKEEIPGIPAGPETSQDQEPAITEGPWLRV